MPGGTNAGIRSVLRYVFRKQDNAGPHIKKDDIPVQISRTREMTWSHVTLDNPEFSAVQHLGMTLICWRGRSLARTIQDITQICWKRHQSFNSSHWNTV